MQDDRFLFYYSINKGHKIGIYPSWEITKKLIKGYNNPKHKKFGTKQEAILYAIDGNTCHPPEYFFPMKIAKINMTLNGNNTRLPSKKAKALKASNSTNSTNFPTPNPPSFSQTSQNESKTVNPVLPTPIDLNGDARVKNVKCSSGEGFYAVKEGRIRGIFTTWEECKQSISGMGFGVQFKKFSKLEEAKAYMEQISEEEVNMKNKNVLKVYCDGSIPNGKCRIKEGGIGIIFGREEYMEKLPIDTAYGYKLTNNIAELLALLRVFDMILKREEEVNKKGETAKDEGGNEEREQDVSKIKMEEEQKNESDEKREGNYYIIHSDSQYAVFSVTVWCYKWKDNGWKDFSGATIKNLELMVELFEKYKKLKKIIKLVYVKRGSENYVGEMGGNARATELSTMARKESE